MSDWDNAAKMHNPFTREPTDEELAVSSAVPDPTEPFACAPKSVRTFALEPLSAAAVPGAPDEPANADCRICKGRIEWRDDSQFTGWWHVSPSPRFDGYRHNASPEPLGDAPALSDEDPFLLGLSAGVDQGWRDAREAAEYLARQVGCNGLADRIAAMETMDDAYNPKVSLTGWNRLCRCSHRDHSDCDPTCHPDVFAAPVSSPDADRAEFAATCCGKCPADTCYVDQVLDN